jgi:hypothetical protein
MVANLGLAGVAWGVEKATVSFETNGIARVSCGFSLYTCSFLKSRWSILKM